MRARNVTPLLHTLDLPLSPEKDHEILTFLTEEFKKIGEEHNLPASWCTEATFAILMKLAGGLWIYVNTVTRFIGNAKSLGPQSQLLLVLSLAEKQTMPLAANPLAAMDLFYDLIMEQIPLDVLFTVQKILILRGFLPLELRSGRDSINCILAILQFLFKEFSTACSFLQSVLFIVIEEGHPSHIQFYHASFMEYARDPQRSKDFCIYGDILESVRLEVIERVNSVHSRSAGGSLNLNFTPWESSKPEDEAETMERDALIYYAMIYAMFRLCERRASPISPSTAAALQNVAFSYIPRFARGSRTGAMAVRYNYLRGKLPPEYRDKIIRESTNPLHLNKEPGHRGNKLAFILGTAPNGLICWPKEDKEDWIEVWFEDGEYLLYETETSMTPETEEIAASESTMVRTKPAPIRVLSRKRPQHSSDEVVEESGSAPKKAKLGAEQTDAIPSASDAEQTDPGRDYAGTSTALARPQAFTQRNPEAFNLLSSLSRMASLGKEGAKPRSTQIVLYSLALAALRSLAEDGESPPSDHHPPNCAAMSDVPPNSIKMLDGAHDMVFNGDPTFVVQTTTHMLGKQDFSSTQCVAPFTTHPIAIHRQDAITIVARSSGKRSPTGQRGQSEASEKLLLWMHGPFGVGKSAIAQNSAEALAGLMKLAASLFFSRPNRRNDPNRIFTSIAYQLALRCPPLRAHRDTTPSTRASDRFGWVDYHLDGFDEIDGIDAQSDIIDIIATSIRERTTPFRWFILSRPEAHIQRSTRARSVTPLLHTLDLPLSPEDDHEILTFLMKELEKIGEKHGLPPSWCTEAQLAILVKLVGGLWIYASTIIRFIGDAKSFGPQSQLRLVLSLEEKQMRTLATNPLAAMDLFYDLIMEQIPSHVLLTARKILLLNVNVPYTLRLASERYPDIFPIASIMQLPIEELLAACGFLQSVLFIDNKEGHPSHIQLYHASFMEYARDPQRSKEFCILGDILESVLLEVIERVNAVHSRSAGGSLILKCTPWGSSKPEDEAETRRRDALIYHGMIEAMFGLCERRASPISPSTAAALQNVAFSYIPRFARGSGFPTIFVAYNALRDNLPPEYRDKIIRKSTNPLHLNKKPGHPGNKYAFILGTAPNGLICWPATASSDLIEINFDEGECLSYETESNMTPDTEEIVTSESEKASTRQWRWTPKSLYARIFRNQKAQR
ncbi:hypothetical protein NP233_g10613 [Leucocoprinus birnbaumii]|uniref:Nephrocystin 3-like N-terminal domain-containing protein n=1 Tax=Leucocoprinus birnbaumii TaxID=56174 RepID=A0AAD5VI55_9AGAR|nr:hypothetical protein NP233_g10613 [Leucocoprinus birnbaumii]